MITVLTSGVFDLLHPGHFYHLERCKEMGDQLVVAVTADEFVNKGRDRPVFPLNQRMHMLAALRCVDAVLCSNAPTPSAIIDALRPQIYAKHQEYRGKLPEQALVESLGGEVRFTDWKIYSSTALMEYR